MRRDGAPSSIEAESRLILRCFTGVTKVTVDVPLFYRLKIALNLNPSFVTRNSLDLFRCPR